MAFIVFLQANGCQSSMVVNRHGTSPARTIIAHIWYRYTRAIVGCPLRCQMWHFSRRVFWVFDCPWGKQTSMMRNTKIAVCVYLKYTRKYNAAYRSLVCMSVCGCSWLFYSMWLCLTDPGSLNPGTRRSRVPGWWDPGIRTNTGAGDTVLAKHA